MDPVQTLKKFIKEVLDGFAGDMLPNGGPGNMRYDVAIRPNDGTSTWEEPETTLGDKPYLGYCPSCGAEPGCNIDCPECMSEWVSESSDPEGPKDGAPTHEAACVLIIANDGKILAVSRKTNPDDFGMPGGKVDPGETPAEAAARELQEETGLTATNLRQVFADFDGDCTCYTFVGQISGEIDTDESGVIRWVDPEVMLRGSFGDYNRKLFAVVGLR